MDFEKKLSRLEEIVTKMEKGQLPLEESLRCFEEGVKLSRECQAQLAETDLKIKKLLSVSESGQAEVEDFQSTSESDR
jgi:exodeoxyribonuclease VII small subunit